MPKRLFVPLAIAVLLLFAAQFACRRADNDFTLYGGQRISITDPILPSATTIRAGNEVTFTLSVNNPESVAVTYTWSDGNAASGEFSGQEDSAAGSIVKWTALQPGTYEITATATDAFGRSVQATLSVQVREVGTVDADVVSKLVESVDSYFDASSDWSSVEGASFTPTGNPSTGSHGAIGNSIAPFELKSVYDDDELLIWASWPDETEDAEGEAWTYSAGNWTKSGNEDRFFIQFPIVDGPGRGGKTFAEAGCTTTCHRTTPNPDSHGGVTISDTVSPLSSCTICHDKAAGNQDDNPVFAHMVLTAQMKSNCAVCHGTDWKDGIGTFYGGSDMAAAEGTSFDIWQWGAASSAHLALAVDDYIPGGQSHHHDGQALVKPNEPEGFASHSSLRLASQAAEADRPLYLIPADAQGAPLFESDIAEYLASGTLATWNPDSNQYERPDGSPYSPTGGETSPGFFLNDAVSAEDPSATVSVTSMYADGRWTVVFRRKLVSGDSGGASPTDLDFDVFSVVPLSAAYTDNSRVEHRGFGPITLGFGE
ncbi:MAG: PKD domain-containing protein [bacterium]|jgi:hypothetical protein